MDTCCLMGSATLDPASILWSAGMELAQSKSSSQSASVGQGRGIWKGVTEHSAQPRLADFTRQKGTLPSSQTLLCCSSPFQKDFLISEKQELKPVAPKPQAWVCALLSKGAARDTAATPRSSVTTCTCHAQQHSRKCCYSTTEEGFSDIRKWSEKKSMEISSFSKEGFLSMFLHVQK